MTGYLRKIRKGLGVFLLGFLLFGLPFNFSFREGEVVFAYNMNNLGRSVTDVVQSPDFESNIINRTPNYLRVF